MHEPRRRVRRFAVVATGMLMLVAGVAALSSVGHARSARETLVIVPPAAPPGTPEYAAARALAEQERKIHRMRKFRLDSGGGAQGGTEHPEPVRVPPSPPQFLGQR